jgi:hypothetical protein
MKYDKQIYEKTINAMKEARMCSNKCCGENMKVNCEMDCKAIWKLGEVYLFGLDNDMEYLKDFEQIFRKQLDKTSQQCKKNENELCQSCSKACCELKECIDKCCQKKDSENIDIK